MDWMSFPSRWMIIPRWLGWPACGCQIITVETPREGVSLLIQKSGPMESSTSITWPTTIIPTHQGARELLESCSVVTEITQILSTKNQSWSVVHMRLYGSTWGFMSAPRRRHSRKKNGVHGLQRFAWINVIYFWQTDYLFECSSTITGQKIY